MQEAAFTLEVLTDTIQVSREGLLAFQTVEREALAKCHPDSEQRLCFRPDFDPAPTTVRGPTDAVTFRGAQRASA